MLQEGEQHINKDMGCHYGISFTFWQLIHNSIGLNPLFLISGETTILQLPLLL